jgi:hypothetical protein
MRPLVAARLASDVAASARVRRARTEREVAVDIAYKRSAPGALQGPGGAIHCPTFWRRPAQPPGMVLDYSAEVAVKRKLRRKRVALSSGPPFGPTVMIMFV